MTVSCKLHSKTPNKAKDNNSEVTRRTTTAKPVRRRRRKKNQSPSALARSRKRHTRYLEKKLAGKPDLALPEEKSITTVPGFPDAVDSLCVKELENIPVLLVVVAGTWCLWKIQHQAQILIQTYQ